MIDGCKIDMMLQIVNLFIKQVDNKSCQCYTFPNSRKARYKRRRGNEENYDDNDGREK